MLAETLRKLVKENEPKYKVYTALISQSGTNAPVAKVLENTLKGNIVWTYTNTGSYKGTLIDAFTENKTFFPVQSNIAQSPDTDSKFGISRSSNNEISLFTVLADNSFENGILLNTPIEIRVYN